MKNTLQTVIKTVLKHFLKKKRLKLAKKLKNKNLILKITQKIFCTVINQSVNNIIMIDFLSTLSLLHQMMFQNLLKNYNSDKSM